jgi:threonine aldolase
MIDLRSDTVTQPTPDMRRVIAGAEVGDDVYHDDPTVLALEARVADLLGKEDAMFTPTGTMANQTALRAQTSPGDVVLASKDAHIDLHELGAANAVAGLTIHQLEGVAGTFTPDQVRAAIPEIPPSMPSALFQPVALIAAENTHNAAGGTVWPLDLITAVTATAHERGIAAHLDGARLWNASVASGVPESAFAAGFATVSVCFSKGLGAPMGSALAGRREIVDRARRFKQMYGGGFRQAGMMAAGALYAVDHHRERRAQDHEHARRLATGLAEQPGIEIDLSSVETNMVYFRVTTMPANEFEQRWLGEGVAALALTADTIRAVTHLHITSTDVEAALKAAAAVLG